MKSMKSLWPTLVVTSHVWKKMVSSWRNPLSSTREAVLTLVLRPSERVVIPVSLSWKLQTPKALKNSITVWLRALKVDFLQITRLVSWRQISFLGDIIFLFKQCQHWKVWTWLAQGRPDNRCVCFPHIVHDTHLDCVLIVTRPHFIRWGPWVGFNFVFRAYLTFFINPCLIRNWKAPWYCQRSSSFQGHVDAPYSCPSSPSP